jgi:hypothetical protein
MKALILGCSHAAGDEMFKDPDQIIDCAKTFGWQNSYPVLIAQQLGYQPQNYAVSGGSNDAMFRIFNEQVDQLTQDDTVIACWTGVDRTEIWHELDCRWLPLSLGTHAFHPVVTTEYALSGHGVHGKISLESDYLAYREQWIRYQVNPVTSKLNKLKNILGLNILAQQRSIPVINIDSFYPVDCPAHIVWATDQPFCDWADGNHCSRTEWGHYFLDTHQRFAELVVTNIKNKLEHRTSVQSDQHLHDH